MSAKGDTFTVTKLDRLARSVGDLLEIVARLEAKKVSLRVAVHVRQPAARHRHGVGTWRASVTQHAYYPARKRDALPRPDPNVA